MSTRTSERAFVVAAERVDQLVASGRGRPRSVGVKRGFERAPTVEQLIEVPGR